MVKTKAPRRFRSITYVGNRESLLLAASKGERWGAVLCITYSKDYSERSEDDAA